MINIFFFFLSVFLLMLTWRFILRVLWRLRWLFVAGFIGFLTILIPVLVSSYQENQRGAKQVRYYKMTHPQLPLQSALSPEEEKSKESQKWLQQQMAKWETR